MSQISLEDMPHDVIKAYILDPDNSPLPERYKVLLDRVVSISKLLDKHPVAKNAIKFHRAKFPEISLTTAWKDLRLAEKVYNSYQNFDFDFWLPWLFSDIVENINKCKRTNSSADRMNIAREHANLARLLDKRPTVPVDPQRNAKHEFYIMVNLDNKSVKLDINTIHKLPLNTIHELNRLLFAGPEIDEQGASDIMNS